jgi:hypothetical protein
MIGVCISRGRVGSHQLGDGVLGFGQGHFGSLFFDEILDELAVAFAYLGAEGCGLDMALIPDKGESLGQGVSPSLRMTITSLVILPSPITSPDRYNSSCPVLRGLCHGFTLP